jgi:UTP-glucose-1-phosphate uridylyltransferase
MNSKAVLNMFKSAGNDFLKDEAMTQGAAIAFYTALSLAPLLVVLLTVVGFTGQHSQQVLIQKIQSLVGAQAGSAVEMIVKSASSQKSSGVIGSIIGAVVLIYSATSLFAQLQNALNKIWNVEVKPGQELVYVDGLNKLQEQGIPSYAVEIKGGKYYDCGNVLQYMKTNIEMALRRTDLNGNFESFLKDTVSKL